MMLRKGGIMILFEITSKNEDERRYLTAFELPTNFPVVAEAKMLATKQDGVRLGNHSHPYCEGFFLVAGSCQIRTWTEKSGIQEHNLTAPAMFMFEAGEEHALTCNDQTILVGYSPMPFEKQDHIPSKNL